MAYFQITSIFNQILSNFVINDIETILFIVGLVIVLVVLVTLMSTRSRRSVRPVSNCEHFTEEGVNIRIEKIKENTDCLIFYLSGYIDTYNANSFQKQIAKYIESGYIKLLFDLTGFNMVSSVVIGCFTAFLKAVKPRGGDLVIVHIQPKVYEVFQLLGFSYFFNIVDTLDEAIDFFREPGPFPKFFKCFYCNEKLKSSKAGVHRCPKCYFRFAVDNNGQITFKDTTNNNEIVKGFDDENFDKFKIRLQRVEEVPSCLILWMYGCIVEETQNYFKKQVEKVINARYVRFVFPLFEHAKYCFPTMEFVSGLSAISETVRSKEGDIVLVEDSPTFCDSLPELGFSQFVYSKSIEEAVAYFSKRADR